MSPKIVLLIGSILAMGGVFLASLTHSLFWFLTWYSAMNGLGNGMCYLVPMVCGWEYFPNKKGFVTGILLSCYGFSSFVFSLLSTKLVNPDNAKATIVLDENTKLYSADVAERVPYMLQVLVAIWSFFCLLSVILISRNPIATEKRRQEQNEVKEAKASGKYSALTPEDIDVENVTDWSVYEIKDQWAALKSFRFYQFFAMLMFGVYFSTFFGYVFKPYGANNDLSDNLLTWAASLGSGFVNGGSRLLMGFLKDKYSFK